MKKIYQNPTMTIVILKTRNNMLSGSPDAGLSTNRIDAANIDSRRSNSLWDDEEEYE